MTTNHDEVFLSLASKLDSFYPLVRLINSKGSLTRDDLTPYFDKKEVDEILAVEKMFSKSSKTRTCGNPLFIHSLRCLIWSRALNLDSRSSRLTLFHDYVEDFATSVNHYSSLFDSVPKDIFEGVNFLTNKYKYLIHSLDFSADLKKQLKNLSSDKILSVSSLRLFYSLDGRDSDVKTFFLDNYYNFYLLDLIAFVSKNNDYSLLISKFIDRIDNTLTELPSNFGAIVKLYKKNYSLLDFSKDLVIESNNSSLKLVYYILYSRSVSQANYLKKLYSSMLDQRGNFYGHQYLKLTEIISFEENRLKEFESIADLILKDKDIKKLLKN